MTPVKRSRRIEFGPKREARPIARAGPEMNCSKRDAGAVVFERGVLEAERIEHFVGNEPSRRVRVAAGHIADDPRQQHEIAVGVPPLASGICPISMTAWATMATATNLRPWSSHILQLCNSATPKRSTRAAHPTSKTRGRSSKSVRTKSNPAGTKSKSRGTNSKSGGTKSKFKILQFPSSNRDF